MGTSEFPSSVLGRNHLGNPGWKIPDEMRNGRIPDLGRDLGKGENTIFTIPGASTQAKEIAKLCGARDLRFDLYYSISLLFDFFVVTQYLHLLNGICRDSVLYEFGRRPPKD